MPSKDLTPKGWAALLSVYVIWGSTYLAIAYVVDTMPPLMSAAARWLFAGAVLYSIGIRSTARGERPRRAHWGSAAIIGSALILGGNGFVTLGEAGGVASGTAGLLVATVPLWLALFDRAIFGARLPRPALFGLAIGFVGAGLLVRPPGKVESVPLAGALWVLAASAIWAAGSLYARGAKLPASPILSTGMQMIAGAVALSIAGIARGELSRIRADQFTRDSIIALAYLSVFGSIVAFSAYVWLIRNARTTIVGTYAFVNPLVAVLLGFLFRDEKLTWVTGLAGGLIVVSVAIIVTTARSSRRAPEREDLSSERLPT